MKGPFRLVPDLLPAPIEDDIRQALFGTIKRLGEMEFPRPTLAPIPVEWIGKMACGSEPRIAPSTEKRRHLAKLTSDCTTDLTILHVHGGAFLYGHRQLLLSHRDC